jgi:peroxiredoxin
MDEVCRVDREHFKFALPGEDAMTAAAHRSLALLALALAVQSVARAQPATTRPADFLKRSMARYAAMATFQATCDWSATYGGQPGGVGTTRTLWYKRPNVFKVVSSHGGGGMAQTSVSDGSKLVEFATGIGLPAQRYAAPPSIADAASMQMGHPMFCGSLLYKFFGGPNRYAALVNEAKMQVSFGAPVTLDGQACKTVRFWAQGPTYGKTEVAIGTADGLVHRIRYGSEPLMAMMQSGAMRSTLNNALKSAAVQKQLHSANKSADRTAIQKAMDSLKNMPSTSLTTEYYHQIVVGRPIDPKVFTAQAPAAQQVQDVGGGSAPRPPVPLGRPAPAIRVKDLNGVSHRLADFKGKVVLIDFWATWCPPCRKGLPETQRFYTQFRGKGLAVLTISDETKTTVQPFVRQNRFTFPVCLDPGGATNRAYKVEAIPTTVVIDRKGNLAAYNVGLAPREDILASLKKAGLNTK